MKGAFARLVIRLNLACHLSHDMYSVICHVPYTLLPVTWFLSLFHHCVTCYITLSQVLSLCHFTMSLHSVTSHCHLSRHSVTSSHITLSSVTSILSLITPLDSVTCQWLCHLSHALSTCVVHMCWIFICYRSETRINFVCKLSTISRLSSMLRLRLYNSQSRPLNDIKPPGSPSTNSSITSRLTFFPQFSLMYT